MTYPHKIMIVSDSNILQFKEIKVVNKVPMLYYVYVKSFEKMNMILPLTEKELNEIIRKRIGVVVSNDNE